jgi:hypothetical protein
MHRNYNSGIYSNNSNRYNIYVNKTTKNITFIEDDDYMMKRINWKKLFNVSKYHKNEEMLKNKNKYYKMDYE